MQRVLVTGATGYIGGRLVPKLLERNYKVRVFVRDDRRLQGRKWFEKVEVFKGDLENPEDTTNALMDVDAAYFLVHSMGETKNFPEKERKIAENFAKSAKHLKKVIYLGGLLPKSGEVSDHLRSRATVGEILRSAGNVTEFRAGPIIGSGSASFEMVRYLTERLPVMIVPRWTKNQVQPIAIRNVLEYLIEALEREPLGVVEIGSDVLSFRGMMETFAEVRGLRRIIITVPVLTPVLSGLWVGLVTPIPNSLAVPLVKGIINPVLADTTKAKKYFPSIELLTYREAVSLALEKINQHDVETRWSGSFESIDAAYSLTDSEGVIKETRSVLANASAESVYRTFTSIGGEKGWLTWNWAWELRGFLDKLLGGPGLRRGRRHPTELLIGEELDFWRVEDLKENKFLLLRAEMKVPGKAWLRFEAMPRDKGKTLLIQTAIFAPKGLSGFLYWYLLYPAHFLIFKRMAERIAKAAEALEQEDSFKKLPQTL